MPIKNDLVQRLVEQLENHGVLERQIENAINTPKMIEGVASYFGGDADLVSRVTEEVIPARRKTLTYLPEVVSSGGTGSEIVRALKAEHCGVGHEAKMVMSAPSFVSTSGKKYRPVILPGAYFRDEERVSANIDQVAIGKMKLLVPPLELAHLLRKAFSMEEMERMGFKWVVVMHECVMLPNHDWCRMVLSKSGGLPSLHGFIGGERREWRKEAGFVYLAPQEQ